jgi:Ni/Fe-hydrogenase subunit HybB-like protein
MTAISYSDINQKVLRGLSAPRRTYYFILLACFVGVLIGAACWAYQFYVGLGAAGINHPVMWGTYLINFVFWIEIGHAGSLMSAALYLCRARWRSPIGRSAEAMTVFAVFIALLFPLIHLGRSWIFYWVLPYPNQRNLWPDFQSPLIFDLFAATGYLAISFLFWSVGLLPDLAVVRDRSQGIRRRLYGFFSMGWTQSYRQWVPYKWAYLLFAALTTAFVVCVASVVSWDYALTIVPGYHSTIYGPYFLVGAIHSGLAMLLTLIVPMRWIYRFEELITTRVLESIAKILIVTTLLLGYVYFVEFFMAWYSGQAAERTTFLLRASGPYGWMFWVTLFCISLPLLFLKKNIRTSPRWLFSIAIVVNIGMWLERFVIIVGPLTHDFIPYAWGLYMPSLVEIGILVGSFSLFFFLFLLFTKFLPTIAIAEMKETLGPQGRQAPGESKP